MHPIKDWLSHPYRHLPPGIRRPVKFMLEPIHQAARKTMLFCTRDLRMPVSRIARDGITAWYIGEGASDDHTNRLLFGASPVPERLPPILIWDLGRFIERAASDGDLIWVLGHAQLLAWVLRRKRTVIFPRFVTQVLDVPAAGEDPRESIKNQTNKNDLNKIRDQGYTYEISRDPAMLDAFYEHYHRPFILDRHREAAELEPLDDLRHIFKTGELLLVRRGETIVSAVLARHQGDNYSLRNNGVLEGNTELIRNAALSATYYFAIVEAQRKRCRTVDFVRSNAFLHDDILQYKKKWNTRICRDIIAEPGRALHLIVCRQRPPVLRFLRENPFVIELENRFYGLFFFGGESPWDDAGLKSYLKKFSYPGLAGLVVVLTDRVAAGLAETLHEIRASLSLPLRVIDPGATGDEPPGQFWDRLCAALTEPEPERRPPRVLEKT